MRGEEKNPWKGENMAAKKCEKCGKVEGSGSPQDFNLFDYCSHCQKNLCPDCMKMGCCGHVPADSGMKADYGDDEGIS